MMSRKILILMALGIMATGLNGQIATAVLDINNIKAGVAANGLLFHDEELHTPMFEVPADSGTHSIYGSHLWIGGMDAGQNTHVSAATYNELDHHFWSGPLTDDGTATTSSETIEQYNHVWKVNQADVQLHVAYFTALGNGTAEELFPDGYTIPDYFFEWPAHGDVEQNQALYLAPFFDFNSDGSYNPEDGDCPFICGDQALYIIFNDKGDEPQGAPLGIEVHAMIYAFGDNVEPHDIIERTVFVHYKIINRSTATYANTYIGQFADIDYGNPSDDHSASFVNYGAFAGTNGDEMDEEFTEGGNYGGAMGLQNVMFLRGIMKDPDNEDNTYPYNNGEPFSHTYANVSFGYGDTFIDNERLGLSSYTSFVKSEHPIFGMPVTSTDYYNYLRGLWKNAQPMVYFYSPFEPMPEDQILCDYMYPGVTDPEHAGTGGFVTSAWSESQSENPPGNRVGIGSSGPFTLEPGMNQTMDLAFVFSGSPSFAGNINNLAFVTEYFNTNVTECLAGNFIIPVEELTNIQPLQFYPNPADEIVRFSNSTMLRGSGWKILDLTGRLVLAGQFTNEVDVSSIPSGMYILHFNNDGKIWTGKLQVQH